MDDGADRRHVPFNRPFRTGAEAEHIAQAIEEAHLAAGGRYTDRCERWLEEATGTRRALLTNSCTAALEIAAVLSEVGPGDEVIMPSFTYVTTATAFVLRGATPVFVDIREDTLMLDEELVSGAMTPATAAVVVVHYGGIGCDVEPITRVASRSGARVVEDAAQGLMASRDGDSLGSLGDVGAISFHETKNVTCGEGGALLVNDEELVERAEIVRDKGTDRGRFKRGEIDKYTWVDLGSSHAMSDLNAAFLWAQLEQAEQITASRLKVWSAYHRAFEPLERSGLIRRPLIPLGSVHNAHMYYLLLPTADQRPCVLARLREKGIDSVFHYVPLHSSPAGLTHGRTNGELAVTDDVSSRLIRLPLWAGMSDEVVEQVIGAVVGVLTEGGVSRDPQAARAELP